MVLFYLPPSCRVRVHLLSGALALPMKRGRIKICATAMCRYADIECTTELDRGILWCHIDSWEVSGRCSGGWKEVRAVTRSYGSLPSHWYGRPSKPLWQHEFLAKSSHAKPTTRCRNRNFIRTLTAVDNHFSQPLLIHRFKQNPSRYAQNFASSLKS
jgi:hypothetical protein